MGWQDRIKSALDGAVDIASAPIGFAVDMIRAPLDEEIGFGDPFGERFSQLYTGLEEFNVSTGLAGLSGAVKRNTPIDDILGEMFKQADMIYSNELQVQEQQVPLGLSRFGLDPGDLSISRGLGAVGGAVSSAVPGGEPLTLNVPRLWQRTEFNSPGQIMYGNLYGIWDLPDWQREEVMGGIGFNVTTGVIDAGLRWWTQPEVLAGKAVRATRARWSPSVERKITLFQRAFGMDAAVAPWNTANSAFDMRITGSRGRSLFTVVRQSEVDDDLRDRALYLMGDEAEAQRYASNLFAQNADDAPVLMEIDPEGLPVILDDFTTPKWGPDGFPDDANLISVTDSLGGRVKNSRRFHQSELDQTLHPDVLPDELAPAETLNEILYNANGQAIEPRDLYRLNDLHTEVMGLKESYRTVGETGAVKYIEAVNAQRNGGTDLIEYVLDDKRTQRALNDIAGKDADYIRRVYLNQVPGGHVIASVLADATTYAERRTVLAVSMGLQVPEAVTMPPQNLARLRALTSEMDALARGPEAYVAKMAPYRAMGEGVGVDAPDYEALRTIVQSEINEVYNQQDMTRWIQEMQTKAVLSAPPRYSRFQAGRNGLRNSTWFQNSPLARPLRAVTQKRPYPWVNTHDPNADVQIVRQMEEAQSLIGAQYMGEGRSAYYRNRWMGAANEQDKLVIASQMDEEIIESAAKKANLTPDELQTALRASRRGRSSANQILSSRRYAPDAEMDAVNWFDPDTGEMIEMHMPLLGTQLQSWVPMTDVRELNRVASQVGKLRARFGPTVDLGHEVMETFYSIWKPSVLLRGGWPIRVVSDEQLRILAKTGSVLAHLSAIETGEMPQAIAAFDKGLGAGQRVATIFGLPASVGTSVSARAAAAVSRGARKLRLVKPQLYDDMVEAGTEKLASSRAAFNGPNATINQEFELLLGRTESGIFDHLFSSSTGQWSTVDKTNRFYAPAWTRALQDQIGRDPLARVMLEASEKVDDIGEIKRVALNWLKTNEGQTYAQQMPWRAQSHEKWVDDVDELIDYYTVGYEESLVGGALNRKVTEKMLSGIDESFRPESIHAEIIDQTFGNSEVTRFMREMTSTAFDLFGRLPTDTLSRQPMFRHMYAIEMQRQRSTLLAQGVDVTEEAVIRSMGTQSRNFALQQVNEYLYNLAETSRFADQFRFMFPFMNAWEEVLTVWGKLAVQRPSVIGRGRLLWNAPDRAGLTVKDDEGNTFIQLRMSEKMSEDLELTGWQKYLATGGIRVGKSSFNMVLNSPLPGVGPLIQAPVNEIVKNKPELESQLAFILPFGVRADSTEILLSPVIKRIRGWLGGKESDPEYATQFTNIAAWMDYEYRAGLRTDPPTLEEVHQATGAIYTVKTFANFTSPAQPIFDSPLKPYIDFYRDLQEVYAGDADEIFLNQMGSEFISLTLGRTQSTTGIPPTVEAQQARESVEALIASYPEYGRMIIGEDSAIGEFSSAAFAWQLSNPPANDPQFREETERRYRILELDPDTGTIEESDKRLGWNEYIKSMDLIEVEMKNRGLNNLRVREAQDLANLKRALTQAIADKYPAWWRDFNQRDDLKWDQRIKALNDISRDPLMDDRPDMTGIRQYLELRSAIKSELNRRKQLGGSATLNASSNQDLTILWETMVYQVLIDNVAFSPIYYRYLEGDPLG